MRKKLKVLTIAAGAFLLCLVAIPTLQAQNHGRIFVPPSSIQRPEDLGLRAHTNIEIFIPDVHPDSTFPPHFAETPASLACVYHLVPQVTGCPIASTTQNPSGGFGAVAIVDAFDNPDAEQDLVTYSSQFGLPACTKANGCFQQVYASGRQPQNDPGGWSLEEALDIEMAHAFAPNAKIILVEAASNSFTDLYAAEDVAGQMVAAAGGGTVTNSWSGGEYSSETSDDSHFKVNKVVYFASTGDNGAPTGYPAASPFVVAAGGTSVNRSGGNFTNETGWSGSGGGPSAYESRPSYQNLIQAIVGGQRGTPDFSFDANPNTGPAMYDADGGFLWLQIGGTSVSSPALAGLVNAAGHHAVSTLQELGGLYPYAKKHYFTVWRDETSGNNGFPCLTGWDYVTGIGSPITLAGK